MPPIKSTKRTLPIQNFDQLGFKIKTVVLRNKKNAARLFFLKLTDPDSSNVDTVIPENITIEDFSDQIEKCNLWPNTNDFLIHFNHIYIIKYKADEIGKLRIKQE
ncbi:13089_t:CDS:2 [Dentiscutata heterogama]|uniref:13089_t:CDS:1 n=1 Tax=Dentiscutata heterogama TaxID=1316150 RepID=A0ACA9M509_9GLOM|nr:13089_t:CDS:2 [Dentiscutata heterogama]